MIEKVCEQQLMNAYRGKELFFSLRKERKRQVFYSLIKEIRERKFFLLEENRRDLARKKRTDPLYDRLLLTEERIENIVKDISSIAESDSPVGAILEERILPNGLRLKKKSAPLGVLGVIYEARPNVTFDVFALSFQSENSVVLKGGSDATFSNEAIVALIHSVLHEEGLSTDILQLLPPARESVETLLNAEGIVDVIIPRGGKELIRSVRERSRVPVIETGAGVVHTYVDEFVDVEMAAQVIFNAKTRRVSVCNALDTLIIHSNQIKNISRLLLPLQAKEVRLFADPPACAALKRLYREDLLHQAREEDFGKEFLSHQMAIRTVSHINEALAHIAKHGSHHSEAILSMDQKHIEMFFCQIDAAVLYSNSSTAFTDGSQFGLGAEMGISTQKMHARGPIGLQELVTYKWIVEGEGQIRPQ